MRPFVHLQAFWYQAPKAATLFEDGVLPAKPPRYLPMQALLFLRQQSMSCG
jgi:hypothetical protein